MRNLHNLKQTKTNKGIVDDYLLTLLQNGTCQKKELKELFHTSEREIRRQIQAVSLFYPLISLSKMSGYRVVDTENVVKRNDPEEIAKEMLLIKLQLAEINSRIKMLKKKEKPLIATLKVLEKWKEN